MTMEAEPPLEKRIAQVLRHLGIGRAHIAASMAPDRRGLATTQLDLVASLTLVCPSAIDPNVLSPLASRLVVFTGDQGPPAERLRQSLAPLPDATLITLRDYLGVNLPLRAALKTKVETPGRMGSGVAARGCADASIYRRFHAAGLIQLTQFPQLVAVTKAEPRFAGFQEQNLSTLSVEEAHEWRRAVAQGEADGTFFMAD